MAEGNWKQAEQHLIKAMRRRKNTLINYLAIAYANQKMGHQKLRDHYLNLAKHVTPPTSLATKLAQAKLLIDDKQFDAATEVLIDLRKCNPTHAYILQLLSYCYQQSQQWQSLYQLLPDIKRHKVLPTVLEKQVYYHNLKNNTSDLQSLSDSWKQIPHDLQHDTYLTKTYVENLMSLNASSEAEFLLRNRLKKHWDDDLVRLYGLAMAEKPKVQLALAEKWLQTHPNNAALLLTLGRLCMHNQLWGKARTYMMNSVELKPTQESYIELAKLLESLNERDLAFNYYKQLK